MSTLIKRLFALLFDSRSRDNKKRRSNSVTGHLFTKDSPAMRRTEKSPPGGQKRTPVGRAKPPGNPDFDPYNTGKFDRGASWEKISKKQR